MRWRNGGMGEVEIPRLPERRTDAHKGDFGRVLVVAGSRGMIGAACLTASAALRAGAGLVKLAVPESLWDVAATKLTCVMTVGLPETEDGAFSETALEPLLKQAEWADVLALGPGIGRGVETGNTVRGLISWLACPLVIDADGLFHLAGNLDVLDRYEGPVVVTPHPGEMAHMTGTDLSDVQSDREGTATAFAAAHGVLCVLKGAGTVVSDGKRTYVNGTGNPGMASGGTGDVLTGVIAGLLAQGLRAFDAAVLGVYLHGLAGDLAAGACGLHGLTATDVLEMLPGAFLAHGEG